MTTLRYRAESNLDGHIHVTVCAVNESGERASREVFVIGDMTVAQAAELHASLGAALGVEVTS